jgi:hypothetical protein
MPMVAWRPGAPHVGWLQQQGRRALCGGGAALLGRGANTRTWYCASNLSYTKRVIMLVLPTL